MESENVTTIIIKKDDEKIDFEYKNCSFRNSYALTMAHLMDILIRLDVQDRDRLIDGTIKQLNTIRGH